MKKFISKCIYFLFPILVIIAFATISYIRNDVYSDFAQKSNYSWKYSFQSLGDISTKKLLLSSIDYNSFIFGSSRSAGIYGCYLQKKIPNSKFFYYGNWNESIGGIYQKIKLIDSLGYKIKNAIIYIDVDFTFENEGRVSPSDHYLLTNETRRDYMMSHYKSYFSNMNFDKLKILLGKQIDGTMFPNWESDIKTNDPSHTCSDSTIAHYGDIKNSKEFLHMIDSLKNSGFLYDRPGHQRFKAKQISDVESNILLGIRQMFNKHQTKYYFVITPLYDEFRFAAGDIKILQQYFGSHVYDFSGKSAVTKEISNYPDRNHFQVYVSKNMLDSVIR